jgi:hypothetical protein
VGHVFDARKIVIPAPAFSRESAEKERNSICCVAA